MKKIISIYAGLLLGTGLFSGCSDYLKEDSGDLLIPSKVEEYAPMLYKEGYPMNFNEEVAWMYLMTDDVEMGHLELDPEDSDNETCDKDALDLLHMGNGEEAYKWEYRWTELADGFWDSRYQNILACNLVIDALPEMEYVEADSGVYNFLASQAYALRAYNYWCLVNTYALPWSEANLDKPGVVLRTEPQIDIAARSRASIGTVYRLINDDIAKAEKYGEVAKFDGNIHRISPTAVLLLASRIALFQEKWDEVIRVGNLFLEQNSSILDLNAQDVSTFGVDSDASRFAIMDGMKNKEIVFTFGTKTNSYSYFATEAKYYGLGYRTSYSMDGSLIGSYEEGDLRKTAYFKKDIPAVSGRRPEPHYYKYYYPVKYRNMENYGASKPSEKLLRENWRSVEVILNLAEAYARRDNTVSTEAIELVNRLRRCRLDKTTYVDKTPADFTDVADLVKFIWDERRRELCFEEAMRFWDLRRQGMPELKHRWYSSWDTYETYTMKQESGNYVLAIPDSELRYNSGCINNARELIMPE